MTRFLLVPGRGVPFGNHWSRQWARRRGFTWAPEPPGTPVMFADRVAALQSVLVSSEEPAVLVAHSAGCLTVAHWAREHAGPVVAALLVTPPLVEDAPRERLPFRSLLVVSRDDPQCSFEDGVAYATAWGGEVIDAGPVGHLDSSSGFGPWPDGEKLLARLAAE
ncbi:RBBP9/YdeN family alpha/beta hydrolase [Actinoplanes couchii]|uniref:RBBP9/YdeN family alpha/beta hydrolase n=1 Tax=Actinoplanes couchii TaxID=403638 RepID=UPI00194587A3|nr:alpha/beta hydrolase [Actinoplanes couchii]MDR6319354.1 putative alpha/beta hydrolase family esterase [Actinoplanes couchii]